MNSLVVIVSALGAMFAAYCHAYDVWIACLGISLMVGFHDWERGTL